jgi:hypothetical protein
MAGKPTIEVAARAAADRVRKVRRGRGVADSLFMEDDLSEAAFSVADASRGKLKGKESEIRSQIYAPPSHDFGAQR